MFFIHIKAYFCRVIRFELRPTLLSTKKNSIRMKSLLSYLVLLCITVHTVMADVPKKEKESLIELYNAMKGDEWQRKWNLDAEISTWQGVTVRNNHVVEINLFNNNLQGVIPSSIGDLEKLESLNLAFNGITGELPKEIAQLTRLRVLKIEMNRIKGELPLELGRMRSLMELTAFNNFITGSIPESIGEIKNLKILNLSSNSLKGNIPKSVGGLAQLESLGLFENTLEGSIPSEIGGLTKLKELVLANNQLGGELPEEFGQLASLEVLQLQNNKFDSFKSLHSMDEKQFLVFDYDKEDDKIDFKNVEYGRTRMADTKFEDEE